MQERPRVGLVLFRADWLACQEAQQVLGDIQIDTENMLVRLERHFSIQGPWVVDSAEALAECRQALQNTEMDMVLLAFQTWAEDFTVVSLLQAIGSRPLVLWCYLPFRRLPRPASYAEVVRSSGPVGAFSALGTLRNLKATFLFTFGAPDDPRLIQDLQVAGRAARVRQQLREARFGLLPSRQGHMQASYVDESRLLADLGPHVEHLPVRMYQEAGQGIPDEQVQAYLDLTRQRFPVKQVLDETLEQAARAALALERLAAHHQLDLLAVNDSSPALRQVFNQLPGLYPDLLFTFGQEPGPGRVLYQSEADLGAATAHYILSQLTGSPTMFLEIWFWDEALNQVVGGHRGVQNPMMADPHALWIGPDNSYCKAEDHPGAQLQFIAREGRVTIFQLRSTPTGWQAIAASGVSLAGLPWVSSYPHAVLRLDTPIEHFLNHLASVGATQHWIMAYGSVLHEIETFCEMEGIPLEQLTS